MHPTPHGRPWPQQQRQPVPQGQPAARQQRRRLRWVAHPPPGAIPPRRAKRDVRYAGPPAYPTIPRWGLPNLTWRWPTTVPGTNSDSPQPVQRLRALARMTVFILWGLVGVAGFAGAAELWRYILLVQSRTSALSNTAVTISDAFVLAGALLTFALGFGAFCLSLWWLFLVRNIAGQAAEQEPPRTPRQVAVGVLVPGINFVLAGSILAELEHAVLHRPVTRRPHPSKLVLVWWAMWVVNAVLLIATIVLRFRGGVQAMADGVFVNVFVDFSAAALALLTVRVVSRMTELLSPVTSARLRPMRVLKVTGAPEPQLRAARPFGAAR